MERNVRFAEGEIYHVYNRGVEKRTIFEDESDYQRMQALLYLCNSKTPVDVGAYLDRGFTYQSLGSLDIDKRIIDIGAWCLMPNHFHLLLRESHREGGISQFMLKITTAYSMYFNKKNERVGSLMQGPFKAEHVHSDRYLQYLYSYIHLNPIKLIPGESGWKDIGLKNIQRAEAFLQKYEYSSLRDYRHPHSRVQEKIISPEPFPWKFRSIREMSRELTEWLEISKE